MPSANFFALGRNRLDGPGQGEPWNPALRRGWGSFVFPLGLFDTSFYKHGVELVKHFLFATSQAKLFFELSVCGASPDRVNPFCFELQC